MNAQAVPNAFAGHIAGAFAGGGGKSLPGRQNIAALPG